MPGSTRDIRRVFGSPDAAKELVRWASCLPQVAGRFHSHERGETQGGACAASRPSGAAASALAPPLAASLTVKHELDAPGQLQQPLRGRVALPPRGDGRRERRSPARRTFVLAAVVVPSATRMPPVRCRLSPTTRLQRLEDAGASAPNPIGIQTRISGQAESDREVR